MDGLRKSVENYAKASDSSVTHNADFLAAGIKRFGVKPILDIVCSRFAFEQIGKILRI